MNINIENAVKIYYETIELTNKDIEAIFGKMGYQRKKKLKEKAAEKGIPTFDRFTVNTVAAFEAWDLDIKVLEKNLKKLRELGLHGKEGQCNEGH